jgi:hypothetical protein
MWSEDNAADGCNSGFPNIQLLFDEQRNQHEYTGEASEDKVNQMRLIDRQMFPRHDDCSFRGSYTKRLAVCTVRTELRVALLALILPPVTALSFVDVGVQNPVHSDRRGDTGGGELDVSRIRGTCYCVTNTEILSA